MKTEWRAGCAALISAAVILFAGVAAVAQQSPQNLGFEQGQKGEVPSGWRLTSAGYSAEITTERPKSGVYCAVLARTAEPNADGFGNLLQAVDATPYRGKRIRFRAAVRTELPSVSDRAQMWLRVDLPNDAVGFFDNMDARPIRSAEWAYYDITGDVAPEATRIVFGVMLRASGRVWIDDASFEALGPAAKAPSEAARALTERGLGNEIAFARLFGLVRYFHPSDQATKVDWDAFAIRGARQVEAANSPAELARTLSAMFAEVAPTVRVLAPNQKYVLPAELRPSATPREITYWVHHGLGTGIPATATYHGERVRMKTGDAARPTPDKPWHADLGGGVQAWVPLALFVDETGTLPRAAAPEPQPDEAWNGNDRGTRLGDVVIAWNVFQHFYPYFDVVNTDWPTVLSTSLAGAATDADSAAFTHTLRGMTAALRDGHAGVYAGGSFLLRLPIEWDWIDDKLVVTAVGPAAKGIAPGDAVLKIDGRSVAEVFAEKEELVSGATGQFRRYRGLQDLASRELQSKSASGIAPAQLEVERFAEPGKTSVVAVAYEPPSAPVQAPRPEKVAEVQPGIFYLDVGRISDADFAAALPKLEKARGIVFDFRGYPSRLQPAFLTYLNDKMMTSAQWHVPVIVWPDRRDISFIRGGEWSLNPSLPLLTAKKAFITDGRAISYAESCMGIVEAYKLGAIVGAATAGTNGNVNPITLPGGYRVTWTGMKVLKHDGSQHHGVGILPTVPVERTRAAIAAGRDEFLDEAIRVVQDQPAAGK